MGFEIIAADALTTLTAHFTKKFSGKLAEKTAEFYQKVKERLSDDPDAEYALKCVEEQPTSKSRQAALKGVMTARMEDDSSFAQEMEKLMEQIKEVSGLKNEIHLGERAVYARGSMNNSYINTGDGYSIGDKGLRKNDSQMSFQHNKFAINGQSSLTNERNGE